MRSTEVNMICNACYEEANGKEVLCESCLEIGREIMKPKKKEKRDAITT